MVGLWDSRERTGFTEPAFLVPAQTMFIPGVLEDINAIEEKAKKIVERNSQLAQPITLKQIIENMETSVEVGGKPPTRFPTEFTSADRLIMQMAKVEGDMTEEYAREALLCVKTSNISRLEELIDDLNVPVETA